jgi:hypothetical protein
MSSRKIITIFVFLELLIIAVVLLSQGYSLSALQTITRFSGRISLFLFSAIFLFYNKPAITAWLSDRFYLLFAIVHGVHLVEWLLFVSLAGIKLIAVRVAGGFLAYVYVLCMPVVQRLKENGRITLKTFSTVQIIFVYYLWLVFFLTYLPRVQGKLPLAGGTFAEHVVLLGWISTLLGMKITGLIQFNSKRAR